MIPSDDEYMSKLTMVVIPNKKKKNLKKFDIEVVDNGDNKYGIHRSLSDLIWLRNHLKIDFPFSYVIN
jgi:hypothetical protein